MSYKNFTILAKRLLSIALTFAMSFAVIVTPVAAEDNTQASPYKAVSAVLAGIPEGTPYYEGFNDQNYDDYYIAPGSRIIFTFENGVQRILTVEEGALIDSENPKQMTMDVDGFKANVELSMDSSNHVSADYSIEYDEANAGSSQQYHRSLSLYTRSRGNVLTDMEPLKTGTTEIHSTSATIKYFRIDPSDLIHSGTSAALISYTSGVEDTEIYLYQYDGELGKWLVIDSDDDSGNYGNASLSYTITKGEQYILGVQSCDNHTVLVTEFTTKNFAPVSKITDKGSVYYTQFLTGVFDLECEFTDNTKETIKGLTDTSYLGLYFTYKGGSDPLCKIYGNTAMLADGADLYPIDLQPDKIITFTDYSQAPAYQWGDEIKIPANSILICSVDNTPEYIMSEFSGSLECRLYNIKAESTLYLDYNNAPQNKLTKVDSDFINTKSLIQFANLGSEDITGSLSKSDEYGNVKKVPKSITLNKTSLSLRPGDILKLTATISPADAADKTITWKSSNESVVRVYAFGDVIAMADGTADITAETANKKIASCKVTVTTPMLTPVYPMRPSPGLKAGDTATVNGQNYMVTSDKTVTFTRAKKGKTATVPASVQINNKKYTVKGIAAKAFKGTTTATVVIKSKSLTRKKVKGCLTGSKVKTIRVKVGKKKENKQYVKKYKKIFTKKNAGRKVTVK